MSIGRQALVLGLLAAAAGQPAWSQSDISRTLLEQGRYWQAQGRPELAEQSWAKLLATDPNQPEALYSMGAIAVGRQQLAQAQTYLGQLRAAAPSSRYVPLLEQDLRLAVEPGKSALVKARQMAQDAGTQQDKAAMSAAIAQYNLALGGKTPQGAVAREYYTNLGYAQDGLQPAIQGLERLNAEDPNNPAILMPLAQHMTSDDARRADGLRLLEKLSTRPDTGGAATEYWRGVLGWMGAPRPQDKPLFEAYLKQHPDDDELRRQMLQPPPTGGTVRQDPRLVRGSEAIKSGDLDAAEQAFKEVLREKPDNADALGGIGVVRMQQGKLEQAEALLSRAASRPGGGGWTRALNTARYWVLVNQANASQSAGDTDQAQQQLAQAMKLDARASAARNVQAKMYAEQGDLAKAESTYRAVLSADPTNRDAVSGLVGVMAQTGRAEQAMAWVNSMTPAQQTGVGGLGRLRAAAASGQAKAAEQRGDMDAARQALEDARRNDPENPWISLDLARYYLDDDQPAEARSLASSLAASPETPDTLYARALLASQMGEWSRAQDAVARIPAADRTASMQTLARQIDFLSQVDQASKLAKDGQRQEAREALAKLEPDAGQNPALLGSLAQAYVDAGDASHGMDLMRPLMPDGPASSRPSVLLPYAGLLIKTKQDAEAGNVLRQLQGQKLTRDQRRQYADLNVLYTVRQADQQRRGGHYTAAYDTLEPALVKRPKDNLVVGVLARMYIDDGQYDKAMDLYKQMVEREPDNANLQINAAQAATQVKDYSYADTALEHAVEIAPDDPDVLAGAARTYLMRGKSGKAATLLERAIAAKEQREGAQATQLAAAPAAAGPSARAAPSNRPVFSDSAAIRDGRVVTMPVSDGSSAYVASGGTASGGTPADQRQRATPPVPIAANAAAYAQRSPAVPVVLTTTAGEDEDPSSLDTMRRELIGIRESRSPEIRAGLFVQSNNGVSGMSKLTSLQEPLEARLPLGEGKLALRVTPVQLKSGDVGTDAYSSSQFGGGPVAAQAQAAGIVGKPASQKAHGVGLDVGYEAKDWKIDVGTTPLGFEHTNIIGGAEISGSIDPKQGSWYSLGASRRAVTDSVLSFAGTRDSRTGDSWGGVVATGAQGQIGIDRPAYGVYGYGSLATLTGKNVASNFRTEVGVGAYKYLRRTDNSLLTVGVNLGAQFYNRNENFYTYGNGGYFSPQSFYSLSFPVTWAQRSDRFSYKVQAGLGLQSFRQESADYFPTSASRQSAAVSAAAALGLNDGAVHAGSSSTGIGYNLLAAAEYKATNNLVLGAAAAVNNGSSYRQWSAGLYLRYYFFPQTQTSLEMPVAPYHSPYSSQ